MGGDHERPLDPGKSNAFHMLRDAIARAGLPVRSPRAGRPARRRRPPASRRGARARVRPRSMACRPTPVSTVRSAGRAVQRLVDAGLVIRGDDGTLHLLGEAFAARGPRRSRARASLGRARRRARERRPRVARVRPRRAAHVDSDRAVEAASSCSTGSPSGSSRAGTTPEATVNLMLAAVHPDTAALRRYLVDDGIIGPRPRRVLARGRHVRPGVARVGTVRGMALVLVDRNVRPHVSVITLNKPERLNSMSFPLVEALYGALDEVGRDNDTWVVVLTGRRPRVLLRARPSRPGHPAQHARPRLLAARDALDVVHERRRARDAPDARSRSSPRSTAPRTAAACA